MNYIVKDQFFVKREIKIMGGGLGAGGSQTGPPPPPLDVPLYQGFSLPFCSLGLSMVISGTRFNE